MIKRIPIITAFCVTTFFTLASICSAATISLGITGEKAVGDTFSIPVYVSTATGESLNTVSTTITFPVQKLRVVSLSDAGIIDAWAQKPTYSNTEGKVSFLGITYNPGFSGKNGKVITITFRVTASGVATFAFDSPSVLANDGQGTEILTESSGTTVTLQEATPKKTSVISSSTPIISPVATTGVATTSSIQVESRVASSSEPKALFDVSAQPVNPPSTTNIFALSFPNDVLFMLAVLIVGISLIGAIFFLIWYIWHRMHRVRRRLLHHIASTDSALHSEFFELHDALKEEIRRLRHEQIDRDLTMEEKGILVRFGHLVEKTERVLQREDNKR